jgi:hypothetical protein
LEGKAFEKKGQEDFDNATFLWKKKEKKQEKKTREFYFFLAWAFDTTSARDKHGSKRFEEHNKR